MSRTSRIAAASLVCATALVGSSAGSAGAEETSERADFRLRFASQQPATATHMSLYILYKAAGDPEGKPSPIRRVVIEAPQGTRFERARFESCRATDEELRARGRSACPPASRVGEGSLTAMTGFGPPFDPFPTTVTIFNTEPGFLELIEQEEPRSTLAVDRATVSGSTAVLMPPATPGGPPDGQTAVREIDFRFDRPEYLRTPDSCPHGGRWRSRGVFTFADGVTVAVPSSTPCVSRVRRPRLRLAVTPRRARVGRSTRFRFRATASKARCVRGARVTLGWRHARTDRRGRARMRAPLGRAGRRVATVRKPGCSPGRARIHARRR